MDDSFKWERQPQEQEDQGYWFAGKCIRTASIAADLSIDEITDIIGDLQQTAITAKGIDYLQTYIHKETGKKIWVIDQVTRTALTDGTHPPEHNYFTILYPHEY